MSGPNSHHKSIFFPLLLIIVILLPVAGCDEDDPTGPYTGADIRGVVRNENGSPAGGASVYLGRDPEWFPNVATVVLDSILADDAGRYEFDELHEGHYRVFGGVWDQGGKGYFRVSPFSPPLWVAEKSSGHYERLSLEKMENAGVVAGAVFYEKESGLVPADSATVTLLRYEGMNFVEGGEATANAAGDFSVPGVRTGNYTATARKVFSLGARYPLYLEAESEAFFCDGKTLVGLDQLILRDVMVEKPAVYIYPEVPGRYQVELEFGAGIRLAASEPEYGNGWDVAVDSAGRIDGTWDYLFYEIAMPGAPRIPRGWCLPWDGLIAGLESIITDLGLVASEKDDFLAYWRSRLPRRDYYEINAVMGDDLDAWVKLAVDPAPDSTLRFWLFFRGSDEAVDLTEPVIPAFERTGTTVVEWGGAVRF